VENRDLFEAKEYKPFFEDSVKEEFEDLAYLIQRGKVDEVLDMFSRLKLTVHQELRPTGESIMHCCAEYGQLKLFKHFQGLGGKVQALNYADEIPLHLAAREGKLELIRYYMESLQDLVNIDTAMADGWTPLIYAAVNGYTLTVQMLVLEGKANLNAVDRFSRSALHWVARYNNKQMVKKLLELGIYYD